MPSESSIPSPLVLPEDTVVRSPASMHGPASRMRFRVVRELGKGGMGVVYEAIDVERHARVAIKTLRQMTPDSLARFKREFRAMQDIHHPNLVQLGELIAEDNQWFFTMELVEGEDFIRHVRPLDPGPSSLVRPTTGYPNAGEPSSTRDPGRLLRDTEVPPGPRFEEERIRASMRQLAQGLVALHGAGMVHRDVKPSNIRIEKSGRLVLLDFGLVTELDDRGSTTGHGIVGTPVYMAPEQAMAHIAVGPEADVYAMGVILFEALTGGPPFEGTGLEILLAKQSGDAPLPSQEVPGIPPELDDLCARLLRRDPALRPTAAQVVRMLAPSKDRRSAHPAPVLQQAPFVGRADELAQLARALEDVRAQRTVTLLVQGESGVGKSSLVKRFAETLPRDRVVLLRGRCYEREAVPYKAFDGVVDELARLLLRFPAHEVRTVLPTRPGPLVQVFPVLRRVAAIAQLTTQPLPPMDPHELRDRAFGALRDLLTRLAAMHTVVIAIDDVQWADADSVALLADVLRPPDAPPVLFLGTMRTGGSAPVGTATIAGSNMDERAPDLVASIPGELRVLRLERLPYAEACELARGLLARAGANKATSAAWIAEEADGHPLFIDALARYAALESEKPAEGGATDVEPKPVRLDDALAAPIQRLDPSERYILELLAVASRPMTHEVLAIAAELEPEAFSRAIARLRFALLITITGVRGGDTVELYHDRIRVAVKQKVPRAERQALHQRLATALESAGSDDAQALATHWFGAGDKSQASRYGRTAAEHAMRALAFDRAATLYDWTLRIRIGSDDERAGLYERLGDALAYAGRGTPAAQAYRKAARTTNAARSLDLRRRAADQLLRAGHIDDGLEAMRGVLAVIGMKIPATPLTTMVTFVLWLARLRVRGLEFARRDTSQITPHELTRIDTLWSVAFGLSITDTLRGSAFQLRNLSLSLEAGELYRVARAMALHAGHTATMAGRRGWPRAEKLLTRAHALARESNNSHAIGWAEGAWGVAFYTNGQFARALGHLNAADRHWQETLGSAWERDTMKMFAVNTMAQLGRLRELATLVPRYLRETTERGDLYGAVNLRIGYANLRWLVADQAEEALRDVDEAMGEWSKRGVHLEHFYEVLARANHALYADRTGEGLAQLDARWKPLDGSLLFRVQSLRILARYMRARLAIAEASKHGDEGRGLLARAAADTRAIARERMDWSRPIVDLLGAALAHARADQTSAVSLLRDAVTRFDAADMALHAACARARLAEIVGGSEGESLRRASDEWMHGEGVRAPARMVAMMAPGFVRPG